MVPFLHTGRYPAVPSGGPRMTELCLGRVCPFCGVATDVPHETQEGCIEALQAEIARLRVVLEFVRDPRVGLHDKSDPELT